MVRGKRICRSLKTADKSLARLRAREILKLARDEQFEKLDEARSRRDVAKFEMCSKHTAPRRQPRSGKEPK